MMSENMYESVSELVKDLYGDSVSITRKDSVAGGDINLAYRVCLSCGTDIFVKTNSLCNEGFFEAESKGLSALCSVKKIGVPKRERQSEGIFISCSGIYRKLTPDYFLLGDVRT